LSSTQRTDPSGNVSPQRQSSGSPLRTTKRDVNLCEQHFSTCKMLTCPLFGDLEYFLTRMLKIFICTSLRSRRSRVQIPPGPPLAAPAKWLEDSPDPHVVQGQFLSGLFSMHGRWQSDTRLCTLSQLSENPTHMRTSAPGSHKTSLSSTVFAALHHSSISV